MKRLFAFVLLLAPVAWTQSAFDGTWKVEPSSQRFEEPHTFELQKGRFKCPTTCDVPLDIKADGSDQPVPGARSYDTLAVKQLDSKTVQLTWKKSGKIVREVTETVSDDGKTSTAQVKIYPRQGAPVTLTEKRTRVGDGPRGAHATSGSWHTEKIENVPEQWLIFTFKSTDNGLSMSRPTGQSYDAKFDSKDYPFKGGRAGRTVSLKKVNDTTIEETHKLDGKPIEVNQLTVEGNTLKFVSKNVRGTTESFTAEKQ